MSKICEACGTPIPEGELICPGCGAVCIPLPSDPPEPPAPAQDAGSERDATKVFDAKEVSLLRQLEEAEAQEPVEPQESAEPQEAAEFEKPVEFSEPADEPAPVETAEPETPRKRPPNNQKRRPAQSGKKPMKKRSAVAIGVLIGMIVALLAIGIGTAVILHRMGFFEPMSDDELLGVPSTEQQPAQTYVPSGDQPEPTPEPSPEPSEEPTPEPSPEPVRAERFALTGEQEFYLYSRGETVQVEYEIAPAEAEDAIEWTSDNELVATVNGSGLITARRGGECTVTGAVGSSEISVHVVCGFEVPTTVLDMNYEDITMDHEGQTVELAIDYDLSDDYMNATVWETSDPTVADVSDKGVVTAVADGTAVITASIAEYTASCIVRCVGVTGNRGYNNAESQYVINYEDVTLARKGEYFQLDITSVLGEDVPDYKWSSDDPEVATVDDKGVVTAVDNGMAYITTTVDGDQFRCIVRVNIS